MNLLRLAGPEHFSRLLPMLASCHEEMGRASSTDSRRRQALEPLLRGTPLGAIWLIGPSMLPQGFVSVAFGWSLDFAGPVAQLDELWLRPEEREQGIGSRAVDLLLPEVQKRGAVALQAVLPEDRPRLAAFLARRGILGREAVIAQRRI